jgi:predicted alpha-1,6-mannanase (GH76 family)
MEVIVGNNCVFHFMGIDARPIFKFLKLIKGNPAASLNEPSIMQAKREGLFSNWEYTFYLDIRRQRILSDKQRAIKIRINRKIRDHWTRPPKLQRKNAVPYWLRFPESPKEQP